MLTERWAYLPVLSMYGPDSSTRNIASSLLLQSYGFPACATYDFSNLRNYTRVFRKKIVLFEVDLRGNAVMKYSDTTLTVLGTYSRICVKYPYLVLGIAKFPEKRSRVYLLCRCGSVSETPDKDTQ